MTSFSVWHITHHILALYLWKVDRIYNTNKNSETIFQLSLR